MASKKKARKKNVPNHTLLREILVEDIPTRNKLYKAFGRVRCYCYKTQRTKPNEDTAAKLEKITNGRLVASLW